MNIEFNLINIFYTVANEGNITKAAQKLYISQPAVTKSIKKLEDSVGGALFIRTNKGVTLTEEGKVFYEYIKEAIEIVQNANNRFNSLINLEEGKIRIGASTTVTKHFLMPFIEKFHKLYPSIEISITNELSNNLLKELRNGYLDFLVLNLPTKNSKDIIITKCATLHDTFAYSKKYIDSINDNITISDLVKHPLITQKEPSNTRNFLNNFMQQYNIDFKPYIEIVSYSLVIDFIKAGFGIGYITKEFAKDALDNGDLIEVKLKEKIPERGLAIATLKNSTQNFASSKLIDFILSQN